MIFRRLRGSQRALNLSTSFSLPRPSKSRQFSFVANQGEVELENGGSYLTPFTIFDTAKNSKCRLTSRRKNILAWYSCGPTVYDSAHIGHASSFVRQDVIRRILESSVGGENLAVIQVMGITNIDDKIILKAQQTTTDWRSLANKYENEFKEDLSKLNVKKPHIFTRVSDYIPQILEFVGKLVDSRFAYPVTDGSVYFDTEKYGNRYGKFKQVLDSEEQEEEEEEESSSSGKRNARDFALWKGAKPNEPYWTSPWGIGRGRPGWHIECSAMASHIFGSTLDLHTGGKDLIFPHHENEEAQCCAHFGSTSWASHWLHMGHLHFKGDVKMSKSLGNTESISSFLSSNSPDLLRMLCINAKYRKDLEYSPDTLDIARKLLKKFKTFILDLESILSGSKMVTLAINHDDSTLWRKLEESRVRLNEALRDDFDTPAVIKILTDFTSEFNRTYVSATDSSVHSPVNFELVLASKIFLLEFFSLAGFQEFSVEQQHSVGSVPVPGSPNTHNQTHLINVVNQFVKFRNEVRSYSLAMEETDKETRKRKINERKVLLNACDSVRNQLSDQIEIKDHGKSSSWAFVDQLDKDSLK